MQERSFAGAEHVGTPRACSDLGLSFGREFSLLLVMQLYLQPIKYIFVEICWLCGQIGPLPKGI